VDVDRPWQHEQARGVNSSRAAVDESGQVRLDELDRPIGDRDIGASRAGGGDDRPAADDEIRQVSRPR
jgi:hypothetical protein